MKYKPHGYQLDTAEFAIARDISAILLSPGLGKTSIAAMIIDAVKDSTPKSKKGWLLCGPLRPIYTTWPNELAKWDEFNHLTYGLLHGKDKMDVLLGPQLDIYAVNPEGLEWLLTALSKMPIKDWPVDKLLIDESTKFKNSQTKRFKMLRQFLKHFIRRIIMTGTPMPNSVDELFAQIYLLDMGKRLGQYITHFRREFMLDVAPRGAQYSKWVPRIDAIDVVTDRIKDVCRVLHAEDYLDMPKVTINDIPILLPLPVLKQYKHFEENFFAELSPTTSIRVALGSAKGIKLRQMASGMVYGDDGDPIEFHTAKRDALIDLLEEQQGEPLLIAVQFTHEVDMIRAAIKKTFGRDVPYIGDGLSMKAGIEIEAQWNRGELPEVLIHPRSAAHGLNLQKMCHAVAWFTLTNSGEDYTQLNARVNRQGQTKPVIIHRFLSMSTVDAGLARLVEDKDFAQRSFTHLVEDQHGHQSQKSTRKKSR